MVKRSIEVKVVDESKGKVTLYFYSLNRTMPVTKEDFKQRVASGLYDVREDLRE